MRESPRSLLLSMTGTVTVQVISAGLLFLSGLVFARVLGTVGFGAYDYADVWVEVLTMFALLGFDRLLVRRLATYEAAGEWGLLRGAMQFVWRRTLIAALIIAPIAAGVITLLFYSQSNVIDPTRLDSFRVLTQPYENRLVIVTFWLAMLVMPLRVLLKSNQVMMQGLRRVVPGYVPDYILRPGLLLTTVVAASLLLDRLLPQGAMLLHIIAALVATIVSFYLLRRVIPDAAKSTQPLYRASEWTRDALPFMLISGMGLLNLRGGTAVVGAVADLETVALYGVSVRVASLIALILASTSAVLAPRIAVLYAEGNLPQLQRLVTWSTRGILAVALPIALIFIVFGQIVLSLFGTAFTAAHSALIILSIGQIVNAGTGVVGWIVIMAGHEHTVARIATFAALFHIVSIAILTTLFGLEGAALATALTTIINNVLLTVFTYRRLRINATAL